MSTAKHTAGPWRSEYPRIYSRDGAKLIEVDEVMCCTTHDANLIAAAPEHHAVALELDRLMLVIESAVRWQDPSHSAAVLAMLKANRAAIAKAKGGA